MKIYICNACNQQFDKLNDVMIPCHLFSQRRNVGGYIDNNFDRISGRMDRIEICNSCLNRIYSRLVDEFEIIQQESDNE